MKTNVGTVDKVIRILLGIALLAYAFMGQAPMRWIGLIGVVPLVTALAGFCPLYKILGLNTCPRSSKP
jgi:hypothetical protein